MPELVTSAAPPPSFKDLMASLGHFLVQWGLYETALNAAPKEKAQPVRADLENVAKLRHLLAHCIVGANADPRTGEQPYIRCAPKPGKETRVTHRELDEAIRTLERNRHRLL